MTGTSVSAVTAYSAHREWASRPPDERYASVHALFDAARERRNRIEEHTIETGDAGIDIHCADRVCVGCCDHARSSLAVSRAICSLLWRSWETADTPFLAVQSETHSSGVASNLLVSRARSGVQGDVQDGNPKRHARSGSPLCSARPRPARRLKPVTGKEQVMSSTKSQDNKAIVSEA